MFKMKYPKTIFGFYEGFWWIYFSTATMPYNRKKIDGETVYHTRKIGLGNIIPIVVYMGTLCTVHYIRYSLLKENFVGNIGFVLQLSGMGATILCTQISLLYKQQLFIDLATRLDIVNRDLLQLRIRVSLRTVYLFTFWCTFFLPVPTIMVLMADRSLLLRILDIIGYSIPINTRIAILFLSTNLLQMIRRRFQLLNQHLESLIDRKEAQRNRLKLYKSRTLLYNFQLIKKIYDHLLNASKNHNELYSGILLMCIAFNYIQCIFAIYFCYKGYSTELSISELLAMLLSSSFQVGLLGYIASETENEARTTLALMGLLDLSNDTFDISTKRNSFLLQGLHSRLKFSLFGLFPFRLSLFIEQISICTMFIFILINT